MLFRYPTARHVRRHGPSGYVVYGSFKPWLRDEFDFRCVYCLMRENWLGPEGHKNLGADHRLSQNSRPELDCEYNNLIYCCNRCNSFKLENRLLDCCDDAMTQHVRIERNGTIAGLTDEGKNLVKILQLHTDDWAEYRRRRLALLARLQERPEDRDLLEELAGYPKKLPDLRRLRPKSNSKPAGIAESALCRRERNELPETY